MCGLLRLPWHKHASESNVVLVKVKQGENRKHPRVGKAAKIEVGKKNVRQYTLKKKIS